MQSTILSNGQASVLPNIPTDGQEFVDSERIRWIYSAQTDVWDRIGTYDTLPLATAITAGLLSAKDKAILDRLPDALGGFGIIVDAKLVLQSQSNPHGIISGDIRLNSESLDIVCVGADKSKLTGRSAQVLECSTAGAAQSGLSFKLSKRFLNSLVVNIPGNTGKDGHAGADGDRGEPGWSDGPRGAPRHARPNRYQARNVNRD